MKRWLSIALLAVLSLPLLPPMLALGQGAEAGLPACCRRDGKHHCMMRTAESASSAAAGARRPARFTAPPERCPFCPATPAVSHFERWSTPPPADLIFAAVVSHPGGTPQTECKRRIARDRSRGKRGPPYMAS